MSVQASDASGIAEVLATYTTGNGTWQSIALSQEGGSGWGGTIPDAFFVQVIDQAGNLHLSDNEGQYFGAP